MNHSAEGRRLNRGESAILTIMLLANVSLTVFFISRTGFRSYVAIFLFMSFAWLYGCYLGFKRGVMFGRGLVISREVSPVKFCLNMGVLLALYIFVLLFFIGLFLQQIGYLGR